MGRPRAGRRQGENKKKQELQLQAENNKPAEAMRNQLKQLIEVIQQILGEIVAMKKRGARKERG
jgi:hypothetical protein